MPVTIDGTTGITTPAENTSALTVGSITGILKATSGVVSQAVAGTDYLTSTSGGAITLDTAQTASGTSVDFTGIPSWVKRITLMFNGVSTNGSSIILIQLGTGGVPLTTGYFSRATPTLGTGNNSSIGFVASSSPAASDVGSGTYTLSLMGSNTWIGQGGFIVSATINNFASGNVTLSGSLDRVRITTVNGTDTFDAGTINISYE
jgi:hypothetical protein